MPARNRTQADTSLKVVTYIRQAEPVLKPSTAYVEKIRRAYRRHGFAMEPLVEALKEAP